MSLPVRSRCTTWTHGRRRRKARKVMPLRRRRGSLFVRPPNAPRRFIRRPRRARTWFTCSASRAIRRSAGSILERAAEFAEAGAHFERAEAYAREALDVYRSRTDLSGMARSAVQLGTARLGANLIPEGPLRSIEPEARARGSSGTHQLRRCSSP